HAVVELERRITEPGRPELVQLVVDGPHERLVPLNLVGLDLVPNHHLSHFVLRLPGRATPATAPASDKAAATAIAGPNPSGNACGEPNPPLPANTATTTAMPNTPPSSRIMLFVPAALPSASGATDPTTEFCAAGMASDTPVPATSSGGTSSP